MRSALLVLALLLLVAVPSAVAGPTIFTGPAAANVMFQIDGNCYGWDEEGNLHIKETCTPLQLMTTPLPNVRP